MILLILLFGALAIALALGPSTARTSGEGKAAQWLWNRRQDNDKPIELVLDLSASLLDSGMPITEILDLLGNSIEQCAVLRSVARCRPGAPVPTSSTATTSASASQRSSASSSRLRGRGPTARGAGSGRKRWPGASA